MISYYTPRENFFQFFAVYSALFLIYIYINHRFNTSFSHLTNKESSKKEVNSFSGKSLSYNTYFLSGLIFRIALLFVLPNLSDDFYRFYWDGLLSSNGISPFKYLPVQLIDGSVIHNIEGISKTLYDQLNSPNYYSIYPPVCQFVSWAGAKAFPNSIYGAVIIMKLFILIFELISFSFLQKLITRLNLPNTTVFLYWLNPLIIIELVGNIHFEAGMICFLLAALYFLSESAIFNKQNFSFPFIMTNAKSNTGFIDRKLLLSASSLSLAVSSKLIPIIFIPLLLRTIGLVRVSIYGIIVLLVFIICFAPFINIEEVPNLMESINLYFGKFEFNASVYYIARWIGFQVKGWNMIATIASGFSKLVLIIILLMAMFKRNKDFKTLIRNHLEVLLIYFAFAMIVHPWYISTMIALAVLTKYRFPIIWSILIMMSYFTYRTTAYNENLYLVIVEYMMLFSFILFEILTYRKKVKKYKH